MMFMLYGVDLNKDLSVAKLPSDFHKSVMDYFGKARGSGSRDSGDSGGRDNRRNKQNMLKNSMIQKF